MAERVRALFVDDDERLLAAVRRVLRKELDLHTAPGPHNALDLLQDSEPFAVIISDQNMPEMKGVDFLAQVAEQHPGSVRIMLTGNNDQATASAAVNDGRVFRFLNKPCGPEDLLAAIHDAAKHAALLNAEKELMERTLSGSVKMLVDVLELSHPTAFARARRVQGWTRQLKSPLAWPRWWEVDLAAMLWPLGDITLPPELIAKRDADEALTVEEAEVLAQGPQSAHDLIANIPRVKNVAKIVRLCRAGRDEATAASEKGAADVSRAADLIRVLIDLAAQQTKLDGDLPQAMAVLRSTPHLYEPEALAALDHLSDDDGGEVSYVTKDIDPMGLLEGDTLVRAISDDSGKLLLAAGSCLTAPMIQKIRLIRKLGKLSSRVCVSRALPSAA